MDHDTSSEISIDRAQAADEAHRQEEEEKQRKAAQEAPDDAFKVSVLTGIDLSAVAPGDTFDALVRLTPPKGKKRTPTNISCVLDVSGSMGAIATIQSASGKAESHGLTLLDVAKHGVKTVVMSLNETDYFSLVTFNHEAIVEMPLTQMTQANKKMACEKLDGIYPGGGTDMWKGLEAGLNDLKACVNPSSLSHVICLTDGETRDKHGLLPSLEAYRKTHGGETGRLPGTISTFGFGYGVDSNLLVQLAAEASGAYSFIPDAGFVGTAFVNMVSQLVCTCAMEVYLDVAPEDNVEFAELPVMGELQAKPTGSQLRVNLGTIQYGQNKDVLLRMKVKDLVKTDEPFLTVKAVYELPGANGAPSESDMAEGLVSSPDSMSLQLVAEQRARCKIVTAIREVTQSLLSWGRGFNDQLTEIQAGVLDLIAAIQEELQLAPSSEFLQDLLKDAEGQVAEALSKSEYYSKWGRHYLPSLMFAHKLQICTNFKDPGIQHYGGELFKRNQDEADEAFNRLPAPTPTGRQGRQLSSISSGASAAPQVSMAAYNDRYAG